MVIGGARFRGSKVPVFALASYAAARRVQGLKVLAWGLGHGEWCNLRIRNAECRKKGLELYDFGFRILETSNTKHNTRNPIYQKRHAIPATRNVFQG